MKLFLKLNAHYVYEGNDLIFEKNITTGEVVNYVFAFGKHLAKVEGELNSPTEVVFYHTDHIGSVRAVSDDEGELLWEGEYSVFGVLLFEEYTEIAKGKGFVAPQVYGGKHYEAELELYYFNARYYDPTIGRFITRDPIRDGVNWFVYASNNPLRFIDPTGLFTSEDEVKQYIEEQRKGVSRIWDPLPSIETVTTPEPWIDLLALKTQDPSKTQTPKPIQTPKPRTNPNRQDDGYVPFIILYENSCLLKKYRNGPLKGHEEIIIGGGKKGTWIDLDPLNYEYEVWVLKEGKADLYFRDFIKKENKVENVKLQMTDSAEYNIQPILIDEWTVAGNEYFGGLHTIAGVSGGQIGSGWGSYWFTNEKQTRGFRQNYTIQVKAEEGLNLSIGFSNSTIRASKEFVVGTPYHIVAESFEGLFESVGATTSMLPYSKYGFGGSYFEGGGWHGSALTFSLELSFGPISGGLTRTDYEKDGGIWVAFGE